MLNLKTFHTFHVFFHAFFLGKCGECFLAINGSSQKPRHTSWIAFSHCTAAGLAILGPVESGYTWHPQRCHRSDPGGFHVTLLPQQSTHTHTKKNTLLNIMYYIYIVFPNLHYDTMGCFAAATDHLAAFSAWPM